MLDRITSNQIKLFHVSGKPVSVPRKTISDGTEWVRRAQELHTEMQKAIADGVGAGYAGAFEALYEHVLGYDKSLETMRDDILGQLSHSEMLEAFTELVAQNDPLLVVQKIEFAKQAKALENLRGIPDVVLQRAFSVANSEGAKV